MNPRIFVLSILLLVTCSHGTQLARAGDQPSSMPWLCDFEGGAYCYSCTGCPQGDSGPLCCSAGECTVWTGGFCPGILGWCNDYEVKTDTTTGKTTAECHDG